MRRLALRTPPRRPPQKPAISASTTAQPTARGPRSSARRTPCRRTCWGRGTARPRSRRQSWRCQWGGGGSHAATLTELGAHQCRWPLGKMLDPVHLFCGEPLDEERDTTRPAYCAAHMARAHQPAQPKKKAAAAELARSLRRYI
ncbi:GcrA family cell cycle regulator [Phenylobacterium sp. J426]|uniref:GcrA family cell cycle regulator n=1 Tax=Phenylobacterium sp. J426 TaxID=2898439 RepID=UPI0035B38A17